MHPRKATTLTLAALAVTVATAHAAIEVTPDHIVSGTATGTLVAIDVPWVPTGTTGGPTWTTGGGIVAHPADQGFTTVNDPVQDPRAGALLWEPDGTPAAEALSRFSYPDGPEPGVKWVFNAASGVGIPDGATINAIYAVWFGRGSDGITYRYTEGAASDSYIDSQGAGSTGDLVLSWTDDASTVRNANFQRIFTGPIVVEGGDGFELWGTDNVGNAAHIDAVVIDVTLPNTGTPPTITGLSPEGASPVPVSSDLIATFSEPVTLTGNGTVTLRNLTLGAGSDLTITLPDDQVSASGTKVTINPDAHLALDTNYAVRISANAVEDLASEAFAGILDDSTWTFSTTDDGTAPAISTTIPDDDMNDVAPFSDLTATFDEAIVLTGVGSVTLRNLTLGAGSDLVITLPDDQVTAAGTTLTIDPDQDLDAGTNFAVQISADAVADVNGNPFAGILDDTTWRFTTADPPSGGLEIPADKIVTGTVTGTLLVVDVPFNNSTGGAPVFGGPDWPEDADDGFAAPITANDGIRGPMSGTSPWEPDGTPAAEAKGYFTFGNGPVPSVTWTFDLPDGVVINAVYATWLTRGSDGITYQYTEGAGSGSVVRQNGGAAPANDLILSWTDDIGTIRGGGFERIFTGPITVGGGDGFTLQGTDNVGNAAHIDAVILDVGVGNSFASWIATFPGAAPDPSFAGDPDGDGNGNGLENFFGTDPGVFTPGVVAGAASGSFSHPQNADPADDITAPVYRWSKDLAVWYGDGDTAPDGTKVDFTILTDDPEAGTTTVTAEVSEGTADHLFMTVSVSEIVPPPPLLEENFDAVAALPAGWTSSGPVHGTNWEIGTPSGVPSGPSAANSPANCAGTNIGGYYTENADVSLVSPSFAVPADTGATLEFQQFIDTDLIGATTDKGSVRILDADNADTPIAGLEITNIEGDGTNGWTSVMLNLPAVEVGGRNIKVEFRFVSDAGAVLDNDVWGGFYVDDVLVTGVAP